MKSMTFIRNQALLAAAMTALAAPAVLAGAARAVMAAANSA